MEPKSRLSDKELEIIQFLKKGKTGKEIASILGTSECTVKNHLKNIQKELSVSNADEIVNVYYQLQVTDTKK